jgi:hypothetical protein
MQTLRYPTLAFVFALILIGYTIWDLDQLSALRYSLAATVAGAASPALAGVAAGPGGTGTVTAAFSGVTGTAGTAEVTHATCGDTTSSGRPRIPGILGSSGIVVGCRIAMGVTMALMLFIMI